MGLTLVTPPESEPVSLAEAKLHCKIEHTDEDAYISSLITAARMHLEHRTRRSFLATTWQLSSPAFPSPYPLTRLEDARSRQVWSQFCNGFAWDMSVKLPVSPLLAVDWIKYIDTAGVEQTLSTDNYEVDTSVTPGRIAPKPDKEWPLVQGRLSPVKIQFQAGAAEVADVPELLKWATKWLVAYWFQFRMAADTETPKPIPLAVDSVCWQYRADL